MTMDRRKFLTGLGGILACPAVVTTPGLLMPVKVPFLIERFDWSEEMSLIPYGMMGAVRKARHNGVNYIHGIPFGSHLDQKGYHPMVYSSAATQWANTVVMREDVFSRQLMATRHLGVGLTPPYWPEPRI